MIAQLNPTVNTSPCPTAIAMMQLNESVKSYLAFSQAERDAAIIHRLKSHLDKIHDMAIKAGHDEIALESEMMADVDIDEDLAWMQAERDKGAIKL